MKKFLSIKYRSIVILAVLLCGLIFGWGRVFGWHRPYVNLAPWNLAQYLIEHQRPATECFDLLWAEIMSPSQAEQRALCVHEYAKLAKEPSACELLMPSSYGLDCVGGASKFLPCLFDDQRNVIWNDGKRQEVPYEQCSSVKLKISELGRQCCAAAGSRFDPKFMTSNCDQSRSYDPLLADQCVYEVAKKKTDPTLCAAIRDENIRSGCSVAVPVLKNHPDLR